MQAWWEATSTWIIALPSFWVMVVVLLFAILHPVIEFPTGILIFTFLATYWGNIGYAFLFLYAGHLIGLMLVYFLVRLVHPFTEWVKKKLPSSEGVLTWMKAQPTWKHVLVIGMPLTYTYPLRMAWTLNHLSLQHYMAQASLIYAWFYVGNVFLYLGWIQWVEGYLPLWVIILILIGISILIYTIKPRYLSR